MQKNKKQYLYVPFLIISLIQSPPPIIIAISFLTLSPINTKTAYDGHHAKALHISTATTKAATEKLWEAIETGNTERAQKAIRKQADINAKNSEGDTALIMATLESHTEIIRLLLEHHACIDTQDAYDNTPLILASINNHKEIVHLLLEHAASINIQNRYRDTALMAAARRDYSNIVSLLLTHNALINIQNNYGNTALIESTSQHFPSIVQALILHGADVTITNKSNQSALDIASPLLREKIIHAIEKRKALEQELDQQNWDLETSSPLYLLEQCMIPDIAFLVCAYADHYYDNTIDQPVLSAMKHYIRIRTNKVLSQTQKTASTQTICCAHYSDGNYLPAYSHIKQAKTRDKCILQ